MKTIQGEKIELQEKIISRFVENYADIERIRLGHLIWNSLITKPSSVPMEQIGNLSIPITDNLYFYNERKKELVKTTFSSILDFIESLEPWDNVDALFFDDTMDWFVALTHEDILLYNGL